MSPGARKVYFRLWKAACESNGWEQCDKTRRRSVTQYVARECGFAVPEDGSAAGLDPHQLTALLTYLRLLADPDNPMRRQDWRACAQDYVKFNHVRQANHAKSQLGLRDGNKLDRDRFGAHFDENLHPENMTRQEVDHYRISYLSRLASARRARAQQQYRQQMARNQKNDQH